MREMPCDAAHLHFRTRYHQDEGRFKDLPWAVTGLRNVSRRRTQGPARDELLTMSQLPRLEERGVTVRSQQNTLPAHRTPCPSEM